MEYLELRSKIIDTCRRLRSAGYVFGTWGNAGVQLDDGNILITPSRADYDELLPEDLPVLAPDGSIVSGSRLPTSEREIHRGILNARRDVGAVVHTHSPYAMMCCALDGGIPAFSEEMCQLLGGSIPISERFVPSDAHAVLLRNHAPVALGRTLDEATVARGRDYFLNKYGKT